MAKEKLKENIRHRQNGKNALNPELFLPEESKLWDTDRLIPKHQGGTYDDLNNVRGVDPVSHAKRHGNYRERSKELNYLKLLVDSRVKIIKLKVACENRLDAEKRGLDVLSDETREFLNQEIKTIGSFMAKEAKRIEGALRALNHPMTEIALKLRGVGPITVAGMLVYVDIHKAIYAGKLWSYVGIVKPSHERYTKGEAGGGNQKLRTILHQMALSQMNHRGPYREVYDSTKARLEVSEKLVDTRNTEGKLINCMWKDAKPSHRHGAALRKVVKHFLADWWYVHRTIEKLPIAQPFVIEHRGHKSWIKPEERGWEY